MPLAERTAVSSLKKAMYIQGPCERCRRFVPTKHIVLSPPFLYSSHHSFLTLLRQSSTNLRLTSFPPTLECPKTPLRMPQISEPMHSPCFSSLRGSGRAHRWREEAKDQFHVLAKQHNFDAARHVLPHGSYLVNLAQPDKAKADQAYENFLDDLQRCEALGIKLYNFHPGSSGGETKESAITGESPSS